MKSDRYRRPTYTDRPLSVLGIVDRIVAGAISGDLTAYRALVLVGTLVALAGVAALPYLVVTSLGM